MRYKNKTIRSMYSVSFAAFIVGLVLTLLALLFLICGFMFAGKKYNDQMHIDDAMKLSGNHCVRVVYFDIVEEPVKAGEDKYDTFYLVTDGSEYRLAVLEDEDFREIKKEVEKTVPFRAKGMTRLIIDDDAKKEIAHKASEVLGRNVSADNMDDVLGDVCFTYHSDLYYKDVLFDGYILNLIFGVMFLIIGVPMFAGMSYELKCSRKVTSLSGITADDIDNEADKSGSAFMGLDVLASPDMLIGLTYDSRLNDSNGQVAFRYNEIARVYSYFRDVNPVAKMINRHRLVIEAEVTDGNRYVISNTGSEYFGEYERNKMDEADGIFKKIHEMNPDVIFEPVGARYQNYRFSYEIKYEESEEDEEAEEIISSENLDDEVKEEICDSFRHGEIIRNFADKDAIFSLKMDFADNNFVDITIGYFEDRENEVAPKFYEFLKEEINKGWHYHEEDVYSLTFSAVDQEQ